MKHFLAVSDLSSGVGATRQGLGMTVAWKESLPAMYREGHGWVAPAHAKEE